MICKIKKYGHSLFILMAICLLSACNTSGSIEINSESGTRVFIDGSFREIINTEDSGLVLEDMQPGDYTVMIARPGYQPQERTITVKRWGNSVYSADKWMPKIEIQHLDKADRPAVSAGMLTIESRPLECTIEIPSMGQVINKEKDIIAIRSIPPGEYKVSFKAEGKSITHTITMPENDMVRLSVNISEDMVQDSYAETLKRRERFAKQWEEFQKDLSHGDTYAFDLNDGQKLNMVYLKGGSFQMGADEPQKNPDDEMQIFEGKSPVHTVELDGFFIGKYELTQEQYEMIMGDNPSAFKNPKSPIENVSWNDAKNYCEKLSRETGVYFRLPTEAEWEYACRAGTQTTFCFGNAASKMDDYAWYEKNAGNNTHPVGQKKPNPWGLYDMHGNVIEWCSDWWSEGYYAISSLKNPQGPPSGSGRVMRGGGWSSPAKYAHSATRLKVRPGYKNNFLGFRIVAAPRP